MVSSVFGFIIGQNGFHFHMGTGNHMDADQFANTLCSSCTGIGSSLNSADVAANHNGHETAAHMDEAIQSAYSWAQKPIPDYELASLRGKIKRTQARLEELDKLQARQDAPEAAEEHDGFQIVRNAEQNRLQILFDGKPDEATRAALKQNGFRWSPRNSAWQRQLTDNAERAARRALGLE